MYSWQWRPINYWNKWNLFMWMKPIVYAISLCEFVPNLYIRTYILQRFSIFKRYLTSCWSISGNVKSKHCFPKCNPMYTHITISSSAVYWKLYKRIKPIFLKYHKLRLIINNLKYWIKNVAVFFRLPKYAGFENRLK